MDTMRIRLPLNPTITTATMFLVLCTMLALNQRKAGEPAYRDINQCLIENIERQKGYNKELLEEIHENPYGFHRIEGAIRKADIVHTATVIAFNELQQLHHSIKQGNNSRDLTDSILHNVSCIDSLYLHQLDKNYRGFFSKLTLTNKDITTNALIKFRQIPLQNRLSIMYALENNLLLSENMSMYQVYLEHADHICGGFDFFQAISVADKSWVHKGEKVKAVVMLASYNKAIDPAIIPGKGRIEKIENGIGYWTGSSKLGKHVVSGTASIKQHDMVNAEYTVNRHWSFEYLVLAPGASMSIDKMHQSYAGIANPITISAPGYGAVNVSLRVPGADVVKIADGKYEVKTGKTGKLMAYLDATNEKGETTTLEGMQLNIVPLPPPVVMLDNQAACCISIAAFNKASQLSAQAADEDIDLRYTVESYEYTLLQYSRKTATEPESVTGNLLAPLSVSPGDRLVISNIVCRDENGGLVYPQPVSYLLK